jgi:hypothetical protein
MYRSREIQLANVEVDILSTVHTRQTHAKTTHTLQVDIYQPPERMENRRTRAG